MSPQPLPAVPLWFARVTEEWQPYEKSMGILGCTQRKKQLERLKESHKLELTCRSYGPGVVKLWSRLRPPETPLNGQLRHLETEEGS